MIHKYIKYHLICRSIRERAESVSKKIGEKLTPEIKNSLDNALTMEEVEEVVSLQNIYLLITCYFYVNDYCLHISLFVFFKPEIQLQAFVEKVKFYEIVKLNPAKKLITSTV